MEVLFALTLTAVIVLLLVLLCRPNAPADVATSLQHLDHSVQQTQLELRGLLERLHALEQGQGQVSQGINALSTSIAKTDTVAQGLVQATSAIRDELCRAQRTIVELQAYAKARQDEERRIAGAVNRMEAILRGTQAKGSAGENILEAIFAQLPVEWQARNVPVGNKVVEFGLRLPDSRILPIDSKWPATNLIEQFLASDDHNERQRLKNQIERTVRDRAMEVRKYIDPNVTVNFGVAVVPDAVRSATGYESRSSRRMSY